MQPQGIVPGLANEVYLENDPEVFCVRTDDWKRGKPMAAEQVCNVAQAGVRMHRNQISRHDVTCGQRTGGPRGSLQLCSSN